MCLPIIIMFSNVLKTAVSWGIACCYVSELRRGGNTKPNKRKETGSLQCLHETIMIRRFSTLWVLGTLLGAVDDSQC